MRATAFLQIDANHASKIKFANRSMVQILYLDTRSLCVHQTNNRNIQTTSNYNTSAATIVTCVLHNVTYLIKYIYEILQKADL